MGKVDCQGSIAAIAHNSLNALTKVRFGNRAPGANRTNSLPIPLPLRRFQPLHFSFPTVRLLAFSP